MFGEEEISLKSLDKAVLCIIVIFISLSFLDVITAMVAFQIYPDLRKFEYNQLVREGKDSLFYFLKVLYTASLSGAFYFVSFHTRLGVKSIYGLLCIAGLGLVGMGILTSLTGMLFNIRAFLAYSGLNGTPWLYSEYTLVGVAMCIGVVLFHYAKIVWRLI